MSKYSGRAVGRLRQLVWDLYPHICCHCGRQLNFDTFTVEHMLPRSRGGSDSLANCRPACGSKATGGCGINFARGNKPLEPTTNENQLAFFE